MNQKFIRLGILINSALYLTGCFVAGLAVGSPVAWKAALLTAAVAYFSYSFQDASKHKTAIALTLLSVLTGAVAGISLLLV